MTTVHPITRSQSAILNLLRFLCSQGVLWGHCMFFFSFTSEKFNGLSSYCVLVFFVLSGYLISYSLFKKISEDSTYSFRGFFLDRFFRIFPPFIGSLVFVFVLDIVGFNITGQFYSISQYWLNFALNLLQLQEFPLATFLNEHYMLEIFRFHYFGTNLPLWTISIEWWLYMFFGFFVFYFIKEKKPKPLHLGILLFLLLTPLYYLFVAARMEKGLTLYWFLGVLITLGSRSSFAIKSRPVLYSVNLILLIVGVFGFPWFGYDVTILIFFLSLFLLMNYNRQEYAVLSNWIFQLSTRLAGYSYSLYLIHYSILFFVITVIQPAATWSNFVLVYLGINTIAIIFAAVFEKHSKKLQIRYENYRSRSH